MRWIKALRGVLYFVVIFTILAICPFTQNAALDIKILGYEVAAFAAAVLWAMARQSAGAPVNKKTVLAYLLFGFVVLQLAAACRAINIGYSTYYECTKWLALAILFLTTAAAFRTTAQAWRLLSILCIPVMLASIYGFAQYRGWDPFPWRDQSGMLRSAPSTFGNPNLASHVLTPAIIVACGVATQRGRRWALLCLPFFVAHFTLTQTRGALLALAGAVTLVLVAALAFRLTKSPARAIAITLAILGAVGIAAIAFVAAVTWNRTAQWFPFDRSDSITLRYNSFESACQMIQDRPFLGFGPGMYEVANPAYWTPLEQRRFGSQLTSNDHVHNEPLEFGVDAGIPAAVLFLALQMVALYQGLLLAFRAKDRPTRALGMTLAAFFLAFLIDGLFGFNAHVPASGLLLFLMLGLMAGIAGNTDVSPRTQDRSQRFVVVKSGAVLACAGAVLILGVRDFGARMYHHYGRGAYDHGAFDTAARSFGRAAVLAPYDWMHPYFQGLTSTRLQEQELAVQHFERALRLHPNYLMAQFRIAESLFNLASGSAGVERSDFLALALEHAGRAEKLSPYSPDPHDLIGRATYLSAVSTPVAPQATKPATNERLLRQAESQLLRAVECGSEEKFKLYELMGLAKLALGDPSGAQKALLLSLQDKPDEAETWRMLASVSESTGRFDALVSSVDSRLNRPSGPPPLLPEERTMLRLLRASALFLGYNAVDDAEKEYAAVVADQPNRLDAWGAYYEFARSANRTDGFKSQLLRVADREKAAGRPLPPPMEAIIAGLGDGEEGVVSGVATLVDALQQHQTKQASDASASESFFWAADLLAAKATELPISPAHAGQVFLDLGVILGACNDFVGAMRLLDAALPHLSGEQYMMCMNRKGTAQLLSGDAAAAVATFQAASSATPTNVDARHGLAQALAQNGQPLEAVKVYQALLAELEMDAGLRSRIEQELADLSQVTSGRDDGAVAK